MSTDRSEQRVSTGIDALDAVLGGLYWGDNVVWQLDAAPVEPFYGAIAGAERDLRHERRSSRWAATADAFAGRGLSVIDAGPDSALARPADLLREIHRRSHPPGRRLLLFDSLDSMVAAWGASSARGFFARCCPLLLEVGAIAYWSMSAREMPATVRDTVETVTQCVLRVDERSVRVAKAEGRDDGVSGSVLHWHQEDGVARARAGRARRPRRRLAARGAPLARAEPAGSRGPRGRHGECDLAGRACRARAVARDAGASELGAGRHDRRPAARRGSRPLPDRAPDRGPAARARANAHAARRRDSDLRVDLVHLDVREAGAPAERQKGTGIVAVASGLVHVQIAGQTPAVRYGEVLVADSERVEGWRNLGQTEAVLFWIVVPAGTPTRTRPLA